jgi:hypothetical protein
VGERGGQGAKAEARSQGDSDDASEQWERYAVNSQPQSEYTSTRAAPGSLNQFMALLAGELGKDLILQELVAKAAQAPGPVQHMAFHWIGSHLWRASNGYYQLVVPASSAGLRELALRESHDSAATAHGDRNKTFARLERRCWWHGLYADVTSYVRECAIYQTTKVSRQKPYRHSQTVPSPINRFEFLSVDFVSGLSAKNKAKFDAVFVITCRLTRMVRLTPPADGKQQRSRRGNTVQRWVVEGLRLPQGHTVGPRRQVHLRLLEGVHRPLVD